MFYYFFIYYKNLQISDTLVYVTKIEKQRKFNWMTDFGAFKQAY